MAAEELFMSCKAKNKLKQEWRQEEEGKWRESESFSFAYVQSRLMSEAQKQKKRRKKKVEHKEEGKLLVTHIVATAKQHNRVSKTKVKTHKFLCDYYVNFMRRSQKRVFLKSLHHQRIQLPLHLKLLINQNWINFFMNFKSWKDFSAENFFQTFQSPTTHKGTSLFKSLFFFSPSEFHSFPFVVMKRRETRKNYAEKEQKKNLNRKT